MQGPNAILEDDSGLPLYVQLNFILKYVTENWL